MARGLVIEMTGDDADVMRRFMKLEGKLKDTEARLRELGSTSRKTSKDLSEGFGTQAISSLASYATGLLSIGAAWRGITGTMENALRVQSLFATEAGKAAREYITLAALQEGGTKQQRVLEAAKLASRYGVTDRAAAFDVVQGLQSARGGDFKAGMAAAREVFAASLLGVPPAIGAELEMTGAALGAGPGQFLRQAYVAGQLSARDPKTIGKAAAAMAFFPDKAFGFASAGVLAGPFGAEVDTYAKAAGRSLGRTADMPFQKTLKKLGVLDASQMGMVEALAGAGMGTPAALSRAGLRDIREMQGVLMLVQNLPELKRIYAGIQSGAGPGILDTQRLAVESEIPVAAAAREREQLQTMFRDVPMMNEDSVRGENLRRAKGVALRRMGMEYLGPIPLVNDEGLPYWFTEWVTTMFGNVQEFGRMVGGRGRRMAGMEGMTLRADEQSVTERFVEKLDEVLQELKRQTGALERSPAGPLKYPPGVEPGAFGVPNYQPSVF